MYKRKKCGAYYKKLKTNRERHETLLNKIYADESSSGEESDNPSSISKCLYLFYV